VAASASASPSKPQRRVEQGRPDSHILADWTILPAVLLAFQIVQTLYWLGLSTWFGGAVFIAIAAQIIFKSVREADPTLPTVLSVNLDDQHATLLASTIVGRLLKALSRIGIVCAVLLLIGLSGQILILKPSGTGLVQVLIRVSLYVLLTIVLVYDMRYVSPKLFHFRQLYIDQADNPDIANNAKDQFDRYSREGVNLLFIKTGLLLGLILSSGNIAYLSLG
jgi:hypothetical protein